MEGGREGNGVGKKNAIKITKHAQRYYTRIDLFFEAHQGLEELLEEIRNGPEKQEEEEEQEVEGEKKECVVEGSEGGGVSRLSFVCKNNFCILHLRFLLKYIYYKKIS